MRTESVMVTGAAGFIGSHLCERLLDEGHAVTGVDSFTDYYSPARKRRNLDALRGRAGFRFVEEDLVTADLDRLLEGAGGVFHLAAQAGVRASWGKDFKPYLDSNVFAVQRLLEAVKGRPGTRIVHASSSSVYGETAELPTGEDAAKTPRSPYGATKLAAEHLLELYRLGFGVTYRALRFFTVYGPRQRPDMAFSRFIEAGLAGEPIEVYGDGSQTRDFTYVADAVEAAVLAYRYDGPETVFNVGGGSRTALGDVIGVIAAELGVRFDVRGAPRAKGDVADTFADTSRARRELGFAPRVAIAEGIRNEIAWYRAYAAEREGRTGSP
jgi:UDP-glucose 4-epimerase